MGVLYKDRVTKRQQSLSLEYRLEECFRKKQDMLLCREACDVDACSALCISEASKPSRPSSLTPLIRSTMDGWSNP